MSRVLVLVPDKNVRELRRLVLLKAGFDVEAPELNAASSAMDAAKFDALVVSRVEEGTACTLISRFRGRNPKARVVAVGAEGEIRKLANITVEHYDPTALVQALQSGEPGR